MISDLKAPLRSIIFCDDIRSEVGGKVSLMGCYKDNIQVLEMPALLPKLCVVAFVELPRKVSPHDVRMTVTQDGKPLGLRDWKLGVDLLKEGADSSNETIPSSLRVALTMVPFQIIKPGMLSASVAVNEQVYCEGFLELRLRPAVESTTPQKAEVKRAKRRTVAK